jgi:hypothetical protein
MLESTTTGNLLFQWSFGLTFASGVGGWIVANVKSAPLAAAQGLIRGWSMAFVG